MFNAAQEQFVLGPDGHPLGIATEQEIGQDFWDDIAAAKEDFAFRHNGLTPVASIPESLVNTWIREGFDFWNAPANEIVKKLKMEDKSRFVISGDRTFDH